jgi:hypothetical protein
VNWLLLVYLSVGKGSRLSFGSFSKPACYQLIESVIESFSNRWADYIQIFDRRNEAVTGALQRRNVSVNPLAFH